MFNCEKQLLKLSTRNAVNAPTAALTWLTHTRTLTHTLTLSLAHSFGAAILALFRDVAFYLGLCVSPSYKVVFYGAAGAARGAGCAGVRHKNDKKKQELKQQQ